MFHFHREKSSDAHIAALSGHLDSLREEGGSEWVQHWFTIEGPTLNWYSNDKRTRKLGTFQLATLHKVETLHHGSFSAYLFNADRDLAIRGRSTHELDMWLRAIELYADLARGGDGTGIVSVPEPIESFRQRLHSGDEDTLDRLAPVVPCEHRSEPRKVHFVDRTSAKDHEQTLVRHADEEYKEDCAESKEGGRREVQSKVTAHPFTFRNNGSDKLGSFTDYDEKHHLVTHHNVDTGVTSFDSNGTMHTNFYF
jgi:hypothetical protein